MQLSHSSHQLLIPWAVQTKSSFSIERERERKAVACVWVGAYSANLGLSRDVFLNLYVYMGPLTSICEIGEG